MVVLLIGMSVMAVLMTAAMPVWKQTTQRDKEAELIFRGQQYVRAIGLFQKKAGPGVLPPNLDVLVQQRFLRKKFTDPITGKDFDLLAPTQATTPGVPTGGAAPPTGRGQATGSPGSTPLSFGAPSGAGRGAAGGIMGVASKSKETSIRIFNGRTHYNEWQFVYVQQAQAPGGGGAPGAPQRGGRGQLPTGPGLGGPGVPGTRGAGGGIGPGGSMPPTPFGPGRGPVPPPQPSRPPRD
jgi:type II secretory pathway pseudopilin PulG